MLNLKNTKTKPRVMIVVEGGNIRNTIGTEDIEIDIIDHDWEEGGPIINHSDSPDEIVSDDIYDRYLKETNQ